MEPIFQAVVVGGAIAYLIARRIHDRVGRWATATLRIPANRLQRRARPGR